MLDRTITVRFDANVGAGLAVEFRAGEELRSRCELGEVITVDYIVTNLAARETLGVAAYNVTPLNLRRLLPEDQLLLLHRADA